MLEGKHYLVCKMLVLIVFRFIGGVTASTHSGNIKKCMRYTARGLVDRYQVPGYEKRLTGSRRRFLWKWMSSEKTLMHYFYSWKIRRARNEVQLAVLYRIDRENPWKVSVLKEIFLNSLTSLSNKHTGDLLKGKQQECGRQSWWGRGNKVVSPIQHLGK